MLKRFDSEGRLNWVRFCSNLNVGFSHRRRLVFVMLAALNKIVQNGCPWEKMLAPKSDRLKSMVSFLKKILWRPRKNFTDVNNFPTVTEMAWVRVSP